MTTYLICNKCDWTGYPDELHCRDEDDNKPLSECRYDQCPGCGVVGDFDEDDEEDGPQ